MFLYLTLEENWSRQWGVAYFMCLLCNTIISIITKKDLGLTSPWLTVGEKYLVLAIAVNFRKETRFFFQSESYNRPIFRGIEGFEIISNYIPSTWVLSNYSEGIMIMPKSWNYLSFFEDLVDRDDRAMDLFELESKIIYQEEYS